MQKSEAVNELFAALAKAQGEIVSAKADSKNPHFKSNYADLASVWDACRVQLSKNGLSVVQLPELREEGTVLVTTLCHSSGQWVSSETPLFVPKNDMQGLGTAITYARRYALSAMVGIAQEDDDGESLQNRPKNEPSKVGETSSLGTISGPAMLNRDTNPCEKGCETMLVSKFNPNEVYCPKCKNKKPRVA